MISKFYEINKYKNKLKLYLFYGDNEGLKIETIQSNFENFKKENTYKYNEKDIIANKEIFFNNVYSKSFFEDMKLILISDVTDKFLNLVEEISESHPSEIIIILLTTKQMSMCMIIKIYDIKIILYLRSSS